MSKKPDVPAWIPSARFEEALLYAVRTHALQPRKGGTVPYLSHLFAVASLVLEDGGSENDTIAALLHDAAEDQGGEDRLRDIEARFGAAVAEIVRGCSEPLTVPKLSWDERKTYYLDHLPGASDSVGRVALADKLHSARSLVRDLAKHGDELWNHFNATREQQAWFYRGLCDVFRGRDAANPMYLEFEVLLERIFGSDAGIDTSSNVDLASGAIRKDPATG